MYAARPLPWGTVMRMGVSARFSRRRDGAPRVRLTIVGPHLDDLDGKWRVTKSMAFGEREWVGHALVEREDIPALVAVLRPLGAPWTGLAESLTARLSELEAAVPRRASSGEGDESIRRLLLPLVTDGQSLVVEEMGLRGGRVRCDVAVLGLDGWRGLEIKGADDTLRRLPGQIAVYGEVFDRCEVIVTDNHLSAALDLVPAWWGVRLVNGGITVVRPATDNPEPNDRIRCELLWRDEALALAEELGVAHGLRSRTRADIWDAVSHAIGGAPLRDRITDTLRARRFR